MHLYINIIQYLNINIIMIRYLLIFLLLLQPTHIIIYLIIIFIDIWKLIN